MDTTAETSRNRGAMSYQAGLSAEECISKDYEIRVFSITQIRWRGKREEIDLIVQDRDGLVVVEVKQSSDFDRAARGVSPRQMKRLYASAEEYLAQMSNGQLTDVRLDVVIVNGLGAVRIIENAFGQG